MQRKNPPVIPKVSVPLDSKSICVASLFMMVKPSLANEYGDVHGSFCSGICVYEYRDFICT